MAEVVCSHEDWKPSKRLMFNRAMEEFGIACLAFDTGKEGVLMPPGYRPRRADMGWLDLRKDSKHQTNLVVDDWGVSVTLTLRGDRKFQAMVAWDAVYAVLNHQLHGWSWDNSMPPKVLHERRALGLVCQTCWPKVVA